MTHTWSIPSNKRILYFIVGHPIADKGKSVDSASHLIGGAYLAKRRTNTLLPTRYGEPVIFPTIILAYREEIIPLPLSIYYLLTKAVYRVYSGLVGLNKVDNLDQVYHDIA